MLPADDRARGHRWVREWLEQHGETDASVLASHADLGGESERAAALYATAAEQAFATDLTDALAHVKRGVACGATGEVLGRLRTTQARAHFFRSEAAQAEIAGLEAMSLLPRGTPYWCMAACSVVLVSGSLGHPNNFLEIVNTLRDLGDSEWEKAIEPRQVMLVCVIEIALLMAGANELATFFASRLNAIAERAEAASLISAGWLRYAAALRALYRERDLPGAIDQLARAMTLLDEIGDLNASSARVMAGQFALHVGDLTSAERIFEACAAPANALGKPLTVNLARGYLALLLARRGQHDEAVALGTQVRDAWLAESDRFFSAYGRDMLGRVFAECGRLDAAEAEWRAALEALGPFPPNQVLVRARLARLLFARGAVREGLEMMERARAMYALGIGHLEAEEVLDLAIAEGLEASGDRAGARHAIEGARARLHARAARLSPELRSHYLADAPDPARIEELAKLWSADATTRV
jgi:tetratricopeptide (TPR) repeat protein